MVLLQICAVVGLGVLLFLSFKIRARFGKLDDQLSKLRQEIKLLRPAQEQFSAEFADHRAALKDKFKKLEVGLLELGHLHSLSAFGFSYPVFFGAWAVDGFTARAIVETIERLRPKVVLELGSGSSSVLIAATLKKLGMSKTTRHIVVDHLDEFLGVTGRNLAIQGLGEHVELWHCPLTQPQQGEPPWYGGLTERLESLQLDVVLVDGPPGSVHPHARKPAMNALHPFLSEQVAVILDDASRRLEREVISEWLRDYPDLRVSFSRRGKGFAQMWRVLPGQ